MQLKHQGLTLIEVLIALAIVAIAMTAVIKTVSQDIKSTVYLQDKTAAMWAGLQVINEARAGLLHLDSSSVNQKLTSEILGKDWYWQLQEEYSANKAIKKIIVKVFSSEEKKQNDLSIMTLESYRYEKI